MPLRAPASRSIATRYLVAITVTLAICGCNNDLPLRGGSITPAQTIISGEPVSNPVMGDLSPVARQVVAGLQNPKVRGAIIRALRDPANRGAGIDLLDCSPGSAVGDLLQAGESRGGEGANTLCSAFRSWGGVTLYMAPDRLAAWDSTVIPIVTAIAHPDSALPATLVGYRSPARTIDLPADGSLQGPILVVVPYLHPKRYAGRTSQLMPSQSVRIPPKAGQELQRPSLP